MRLIDPSPSSKIMEQHNSAICAPNISLKLSENQMTTSFIYLTSPNFVTMCHTN